MTTPTTNSAANHTDGVAPANVIYNNDITGSIDIDDLIPIELREAINGANVEEKETTKEEEEEQKETEPEKVEDINTYPIDPEPEQEEKEEEEIEEEPAEEPAEEKKEEEKTSPPTTDEDLDISPEAIDKLLKGDIDAVIKKPASKKEEKPFWHEDDDYKSLSKQLDNYGVKKGTIDKLIQKVADKHVIENGNLIQGLEKKAIEAEKTTENYKNELIRLQAIEREVRFDTADTTKEKYGIPMSDAAKEIAEVLQREGVNVSLSSVLLAKNKTDMVKILGSHSLEDKDLTKITNQWRNYKELETAYSAARSESTRNLSKALATNISNETVHSILRTSLADFLKNDAKYKYIEDAIKDGVEKHPDITNIIGLAKNNFVNFVNALSSPSEYVHSEKWLSSLAKYSLDSAHNKHIQDKFYILRQEHTKALESLKKIVVQYKKLAGSAKGITGSGKGVASGKGNSSASTKQMKKQEDEILSEFKELLKNEKKIDDILPAF